MYVKRAPGSLAEPWRVALAEAWDAYAAGTVPVGAVVVDVAGRVVCRGRNRVLDSAVAGQIGRSRLAHAEVNALLGLAGTTLDPRGLALYTTLEPCPLCVGAIVMANVRAIHYAARESFTGSIGLLDATPYLRSKAIVVYPPTDPMVEAVITAMAVEFHLRVGGPRVRELVSGSFAVHPGAVRLAERLAAGGDWERLRRMPAQEGFAHLARGLDS